jgi:hypothetical protein
MIMTEDQIHRFEADISRSWRDLTDECKGWLKAIRSSSPHDRLKKVAILGRLSAAMLEKANREMKADLTKNGV